MRNYDALSALTTYMDTDLNSLADDTTNIGAIVLDNSLEKRFYGAAELILSQVDLSAQINSAVELYMIPSIDAINYVDDGTDASTTDTPPITALVGIFSIQETDAAHRSAIELFELGPYKYTPVLINKTGVAFGATGNILKIATFS